MLSLSNMLHKLHFLNDSLSVALASFSYDLNSAPFTYYIGNIYVVGYFFFSFLTMIWSKIYFFLIKKDIGSARHSKRVVSQSSSFRS